MGIMIRGRCSTCDRTGRLIDPENIFCSEKCRDPKEIKRADIRKLKYFLLWAAAIGIYIFYVCHQAGHSLFFSVIISIVCGFMTSAMMFVI